MCILFKSEHSRVFGFLKSCWCWCCWWRLLGGMASSPDNARFLESIHPSVSVLSCSFSCLVVINPWEKAFQPFPAPVLFGSSFQYSAQLIMSPCSLPDRKADEEKKVD